MTRSPGCPDTGAISAIPPGDMLETWQGNSRAVGQHVAAEQVDAHALETPASSLSGKITNFFAEATCCLRSAAPLASRPED
jgi:hypothetical protein